MASHTTTRQGRPEATAAMCCTVAVLYSQVGKQMRSHFEYQNRKRQQQPQPEASCHVVKFITRPRGCRSYERLQCHSTDRTASGTTAAYLRASDMSTHLQNSLFPPGCEAVLSDQADFVMIVVMVMGMFTGIFGKITIGMGFKFTHSWRSRNKVGGPGIECCCAPCRAGWPSRTRDLTLCNTWPSSGDNVCSEAVWLLCCTALSFSQ